MLSEWVCYSKPMQDLLQLVDRVKAAKGSILILGGSGTGKSQLARYIHEKSGLNQESFVYVDCAAIPESLFESELFGSVRGAYSDATADRPGLVSRAEGGTLYFHHIEAFSLSLQSKILRFVADGEYRPVGGSVTHKLNTRIIASSTQNLPELIESGNFRQDLYYRISVFTLQMPPLKARLKDIKTLIEIFQRECPQERLSLESISPRLYTEILTHDWPGNARELKNWVERCNSIGEWHSPKVGIAGLGQLRLKDAVQIFKQEYIRFVLDSVDGNQTKAARLLGINRTYLIKLLHNFSNIKKETING